MVTQGEIIHYPGSIGECLHKANLCIVIENGHAICTEIVDNHDKLKKIDVSKKNERHAAELDLPTFLHRQAF